MNPHGPIRAAAAVTLMFALGCARSASEVSAPGVAGEPTLELGVPAVNLDREAGTGSHLRRALFPLTPGNHWTYDYTFSTSTSPVGPPDYKLQSSVESDLTCPDTFDGHTYLADRRVESMPRFSSTTWLYLRQDALGLHEADRVDGSPPPCEGIRAGTGSAAPAAPVDEMAAGIEAAFAGRAGVLAEVRRQRALLAWIRGRFAGGPAPEIEGVPAAELLRLAYPIHVNRRWVIRESPLFSAQVVARQRLETAAGSVLAYKIRIEGEGFGPLDQVFVWYGPVGYVGMAARLEGESVDPQGNLTGPIISEQREILTSYLLGDPIATVNR